MGTHLGPEQTCLKSHLCSPSLSESLKLSAPPFSQLGDVLLRKCLPSVGIKQNLYLSFLYIQGIRAQRTQMGDGCSKT